MDNILFQCTLYRDHTIAVRGRPVEGKDYHEAVAEVLRIVAQSIEDGATILEDTGQVMQNEWRWRE